MRWILSHTWIAVDTWASKQGLSNMKTLKLYEKIMVKPKKNTFDFLLHKIKSLQWWPWTVNINNSNMQSRSHVKLPGTLNEFHQSHVHV